MCSCRDVLGICAEPLWFCTLNFTYIPRLLLPRINTSFPVLRVVSFESSMSWSWKKTACWKVYMQSNSTSVEYNNLRQTEGELNSTYGNQREIINNSQESTLSEEVKPADALRGKVELENGKVWHPPRIQFWENQRELNSLWLLAPCLTSSVSFSKNTDASGFDTLQVPGFIANHTAAIQPIT